MFSEGQNIVALSSLPLHITRRIGKQFKWMGYRVKGGIHVERQVKRCWGPEAKVDKMTRETPASSGNSHFKRVPIGPG